MIVELEKYTDKRGFLIEFLKKTELVEKNFGQIYCATLIPGAWRGNHYHKKKEEWFVALNGTIEITLVDIKNGERQAFSLASDDILFKVKVERNVAHVFKNTSDSIVVIVGYATKIYNSKNPDNWKYEILK